LTSGPWHPAFFAVAAVVELCVLLGILRSPRPHSLWLRALIAAVAGAAALWFAAQDTAGAPEYVFMHQRWLVALIISCLVLVVASGIAQIRSRFAARRKM